MTNQNPAQPLFDGGNMLAPCLDRYLDRDTLGTDEDRKLLIEVVADVYRYNPGPNHTTTPRTYARRFVEPIDAVTVNILHTSWLRKLITNGDISKMKAVALSPLDVRNYTLLLLGALDLPKQAGSMRQFLGMHPAVKPDEWSKVNVLDLSTNDLYMKHLAIFRFSVDVSDRWRNATIFLKRSSDDLLITPDIYDLIWDHPERAETLADIIVSRKTADVELLREAAESTVSASLSEGIL